VLAAKSLGYPRVICLIEEADYEPLCEELGLEETLNPLHSVSQRPADIAEHREPRDRDERHETGIATGMEATVRISANCTKSSSGAWRKSCTTMSIATKPTLR